MPGIIQVYTCQVRHVPYGTFITYADDPPDLLSSSDDDDVPFGLSPPRLRHRAETFWSPVRRRRRTTGAFDPQGSGGGKILRQDPKTLFGLTRGV